MTKEQDIFNFIFNEMNQITIANGYSFDIGGRVYDWRDSPFEPGELPAINIKDISNDTTEDNERQHLLTLDIELSDTGETAPDSVREKKQDIITAFANILGADLVEHAFLIGTETFSEKENVFVVNTALQFAVQYQTDEEWEI